MRIRTFIVRCLVATIWTIFLVLAFHAFVVNIGYPWWDFFCDFYPWLAAILGFSSVYLIALFRAKKDSTVHWIALSFLILTLVCRLLWVHYFDSQQFSDYLLYWNVGHSIVVNGMAAQNGTGLYFLRSIFYTAPIQYIFGNNQQYLELVNVFLVTITMVILYEFGRRVFSAKIAAGALLFFFWNPDLWYGMTLANHDIAYLPWLAGLCLVIYWLDKKLHDKPRISIPVVLLSVTAGLLIFFLEVQRSYGLFAWVALLILVAYYLYNHYRENRVTIVNKARRAHILGKDWWKRSLVFILIFLIIPLGTYELSKSVFINVTGMWSKSNYLTTLAMRDVLGSGPWKEMQPWREIYSWKLPDELRTEFSIRKFLSEVCTEPVETIRYTFRKNAVLADPGQVLWFSSRPAEDPGVGRTNSKDLPMQMGLQRLLAAILFFLLALRLLLHPFFPIKRGAPFLIFFTAVLYASILLFTMVESYYRPFTVFLTSLLIAQLLLGEWTLRDITWWKSKKPSKQRNLEEALTDENS